MGFEFPEKGKTWADFQFKKFYFNDSLFNSSTSLFYKTQSPLI